MSSCRYRQAERCINSIAALSVKRSSLRTVGTFKVRYIQAKYITGSSVLLNIFRETNVLGFSIQKPKVVTNVAYPKLESMQTPLVDVGRTVEQV